MFCQIQTPPQSLFTTPLSRKYERKCESGSVRVLIVTSHSLFSLSLSCSHQVAPIVWRLELVKYCPSLPMLFLKSTAAISVGGILPVPCHKLTVSLCPGMYGDPVDRSIAREGGVKLKVNVCMVWYPARAVLPNFDQKKKIIK